MSGFATNQPSEEAARRQALERCNEGRRTCSVLAVFEQCAAWSYDTAYTRAGYSRAVGWAMETDEEGALETALAKCREAGGVRCRKDNTRSTCNGANSAVQWWHMNTRLSGR